MRRSRAGTAATRKISSWKESGPARSLLVAGLAALLAGGVTVASGGATASASIRPASALVNGGSTASLAPVSGSIPRLPAGTRVVGPLPGSRRLRIDVALAIPDPAALGAYIAGTSDRSSPYFDKFLDPTRFGARFGASATTIAAVEAALRSAGLRPLPVTADHLSIPVVATTGELDSAFDISIESLRLPDGEVRFANTSSPLLPPAVSRQVEAVLGISDVTVPQPLVASPRGLRPHATRRSLPARQAAATRSASTSGPAPCSDASSAGQQESSYTANQLAGVYGLSPLYSMGDTGAGTSIGLIELATNTTSDIATYQKCYRTSVPVSYHTVASGPGSGGGNGNVEATLDIEDVIGLAPGAAIDVWQALNNTNGSEYDALHAAILNGFDQVISTSWGECEGLLTSGYLGAEADLFSEAASEGITMLSAAGDDGSEDCGNQNLAVDDPASQVNVVGVGGTTLTLPHREVVWNDSDEETGAGGGGDSSVWAMPSYQSGYDVENVINTNSADDCGSNFDQECREVPDVSADADPDTGYVIYMAGSEIGGWGGIGGTSAAAPLWAASAALVNDSPYCSYFDASDPGTLPAGLYYIAGARGLGGDHYRDGYYDVTSGNNDYTPNDGGSNGGLYPAGPGYDMASGLGTPHFTNSAPYASGIAADMCFIYGRRTSTHITSVTPAGAAYNVPTKVTIEGTGFLPIARADRLTIGSTMITDVSCTSTTRCVAVVPPAPHPETVDIRMRVADLAESPVSFSDEYTYVGPEGYWLVGANGHIVTAGDAHNLGSLSTTTAGPVVALATTGDGRGYWITTRDGTVQAFGNAVPGKDLPGIGVHVDNIVGMAPTGDGAGYWLVGSDGGLFAFGNASYHGSLPGLGVHVDNVVGMVSTSDGGGYWLVGADGGVFAFGDASYVGSLPGLGVHVHNIVSLIGSPTGHGYVLVSATGGTFVFGTGVNYYGSLPGEGTNVDDIVGLALTGAARGYWLVGSSGAVYPFGDAENLGTPSGLSSDLPIAGIAAT